MTVLKRDIVRMWNDLWNTFPQNVASLPQMDLLTHYLLKLMHSCSLAIKKPKLPKQLWKIVEFGLHRKYTDFHVCAVLSM